MEGPRLRDVIGLGSFARLVASPGEKQNGLFQTRREHICYAGSGSLLRFGGATLKIPQSHEYLYIWLTLT